DCPRNADATRLGQAFQACGNVDPVAVESLSLYRYIAQIDADTKLHPALLGQLCVFNFQFLLDFDPTPHGIYDTGKFGQQIVSWRVYHSATVLLDKGRHHPAINSQSVNSRFLILTHEAAIAFDIGAEDRRQLALHTWKGCVRG